MKSYTEKTTVLATMKIVEKYLNMGSDGIWYNVDMQPITQQEALDSVLARLPQYQEEVVSEEKSQS